MPELEMESARLAPAVLVLQFVRDLITVSPRHSYSRDEVLILIDLVGHDRALFPDGLWEAVEADQGGGNFMRYWWFTFRLGIWRKLQEIASKVLSEEEKELLLGELEGMDAKWGHEPRRLL